MRPVAVEQGHAIEQQLPETAEAFQQLYAVRLVATPITRSAEHRRAYRNYTLSVFAVVCGEVKNTAGFDITYFNETFDAGLDAVAANYSHRYNSLHPTTKADWLEYLCHHIAPNLQPVGKATMPTTYVELLQEIEAGQWQHELD